jgi:hypothetical protein
MDALSVNLGRVTDRDLINVPEGGEGRLPAMTMTVTLMASRPHTDQVADDPGPEVPAGAQRRRYSAAAYKQRILADYKSLDRAGKGALLRREGDPRWPA